MFRDFRNLRSLRRCTEITPGCDSNDQKLIQVLSYLDYLIACYQIDCYSPQLCDNDGCFGTQARDRISFSIAVFTTAWSQCLARCCRVYGRFCAGRLNTNLYWARCRESSSSLSMSLYVKIVQISSDIWHGTIAYGLVTQ